jgi:hypothetical protein
VEIQPHSLLTSELDGGEWQASSLGLFTPRKEHPIPSEYEVGWESGVVRI